MSVNKFIGLGRLTKDVELKHIPSGNAVANFSIAMGEKYKDKAGVMQEKTEFLNIVVWGKLAEICNQYLSKGKQVYLEGKVTTRSYDDKDGNKRYVTEILASSVQFIGSNDNQNSVNNAPAPAADKNFATDDIPF